MLHGGLREVYTRSIDKELRALRALALDLHALTEPGFVVQTLHKQDADTLLPRGSSDSLVNLGQIACVATQDESTTPPVTFIIPYPTAYCRWLQRQRRYVPRSRLEMLRGATLDIRRRKEQKHDNGFKMVLQDWQTYNTALKRWIHLTAPKQYVAFQRRKEKYSYLTKGATP